MDIYVPNSVWFATGHRPDKLGGYSNVVQAKLVELAARAIEQIRPQQVITGMALGWDTAIALACLNLGVKYVAAVPFETQDCKWPESSRKLYRALLNQAYEVVIVCEGGYAPEKMQKRNEWMVNNGEYGLALWNGMSGGTANCIRYATTKHKPILNVWNKYHA